MEEVEHPFADLIGFQVSERIMVSARRCLKLKTTIETLMAWSTAL